MRRAEPAAASPAMTLAIALLLAGCVTATRPRPEAPRDAKLLFEGTVAGARVYLDDKLVGWLKDLPRPLPVVAGAHRVEIRAEGRYTAYYDVTIPRHESRSLTVQLASVPAGEPGD